MGTYKFTVVLASADVTTAGMAKALYEAGCHDSTPGNSNGVATVAFVHKAMDLPNAVGSAIKDIYRAGYRVASVEIDH